MDNDTKVKDFIFADGLKCRYCGADGMGTYLECVDGDFTCGKCWLEKITLHDKQREVAIEESKQKAAKKQTRKSTTKK